MPTWLKVLLGVVALLVVLLIAAVVAGVYAVRRYGPELVEATKRNVEEGQEYGRRTDNEGCLNEAVARQARAEGFRDLFKNNLFLRGCLIASKPTPGFCDGVPGRTDFMKGVGWQAQQCQRYGLTPQQQCSQLFQQVQQFCEQRRAAPEGPPVPGPSIRDDAAPPPPPAPKSPARTR